MEKREKVGPAPGAPEGTGGARLGVYAPEYPYKDASQAYFRQCVGEETYRRAMSSEAGQRHPYVVARAFLNQADWEKYCWIEQYGSLEGFPG